MSDLHLRWRDVREIVHEVVAHGVEPHGFEVRFESADTICGVPMFAFETCEDEITCPACLDAISPIDREVERAFIDAWIATERTVPA